MQSLSEQVAKVILQQAALPPHMEGSVVFASLHQCLTPLGQSEPIT